MRESWQLWIWEHKINHVRSAIIDLQVEPIAFHRIHQAIFDNYVARTNLKNVCLSENVVANTDGITRLSVGPVLPFSENINIFQTPRLPALGCGCRHCMRAESPANSPHLRPVQCAVQRGPLGSTRGSCSALLARAAPRVMICVSVYKRVQNVLSAVCFMSVSLQTEKPGVVLRPPAGLLPANKRLLTQLWGASSCSRLPESTVNNIFLWLLFFFFLFSFLSPAEKRQVWPCLTCWHNDTMSVWFHSAPVGPIWNPFSSLFTVVS